MAWRGVANWYWYWSVVVRISRAETLLGVHREAAQVDATTDTTTRDRLEREAFGAWSTLPFALKLKLFNNLCVPCLTRHTPL